ncbi:AraC family transcriptional regulator [Rhizobium halophytocola]|uniref:AraC-like DNA-binding protein n=1 Tax=Rhizobium halophytocola TaxID=735519 RepID=A0ABS4E602_9HYPH|nr:AraC family transcriptional regulator [Rhizobium halophytocola]MBP1853377.1 AraC-like DNA-binding protein [Rhizobium halophytocola]
MTSHILLKNLIARHATNDGVQATAVPRLQLIRMSQPTEPLHAVHKPAVCILVQGRKRVSLCDKVVEYGAGSHLIVSLELPVVGHVIDATEDEPYLCLRLELDLATLGHLVLEIDEELSLSSPACTALGVGDTPQPLADAAARLVGLLDRPKDIPFLAPLIEREILYLLLRGDHAGLIHRMLTPNHRMQNVNRAISWIRANFHLPFSMEQLASEARMSASSLHEHFRTMTNMSPLQYQKQLRLQEARRLILTEAMDAATAGRRVGYDSPSQFSREYRRQYGAPPVSDISRLKVRPERFAEA